MANNETPFTHPEKIMNRDDFTFWSFPVRTRVGEFRNEVIYQTDTQHLAVILSDEGHFISADDDASRQWFDENREEILEHFENWVEDMLGV